jgi:hypothetical protein
VSDVAHGPLVCFLFCFFVISYIDSRKEPLYHCGVQKDVFRLIVHTLSFYVQMFRL